MKRGFGYRTNRRKTLVTVTILVTMAICLFAGQKEFIYAGTFDSAKAFYDSYGNAAVFRATTTTDGLIYCGTMGAEATSGVRYRTIGWRLRFTDGSGRYLQDLYYAVGGSYLRLVSTVSSEGYEYNLYTLGLSAMKGRVSATTRDALAHGNCRITLDACMVVAENGRVSGSMNDSGITGGSVYMSYGGIASARNWTPSSKAALYSYFSKTVQGLWCHVNVTGGTGIERVAGGGTYCYGTYVNVSCSVAYGYDFAGWKGSGFRSGSCFGFTATGNSNWTAYANPKQVTVVYHRNQFAEDEVTEAITYSYGGNHSFSGGLAWKLEGYHKIGYMNQSILSDEIRNLCDSDVVSVNLNQAMTGDWIVNHHQQTIHLYVGWRINHYTITFHGNGAGGGSVEAIEADSDECITLPENGFLPTEEPSTFVGWGSSADLLEEEYLAESEHVMLDLARDFGLEYQDKGQLKMYAIWDYAPRIEAYELYYSLEDADDGKISKNELARYAKVEDREDGTLEFRLVPPPNEEENGFYIENYPENGFVGYTVDCSIPITYVAYDHAGNVTKNTVRVHLVDTDVKLRSEAVGNIRFIDEARWNGGYGNVSEGSVWRKLPEYRSLLEEALEEG